MNIFVYSDESGVFDKIHNDIFVFGGLIFLSKDEKDLMTRKYIAAENVIRRSEGFKKDKEAKATTITNKSKGKLYRSLNNAQKFGVIINQDSVLDNIFSSKKSKQRYLDYAYKIGIKRKFQDLIKRKIINPVDVDNIFFFVDEHTTATDGRYELKELLEQEFKYGTYNWNYSKFFRPIFPNLKTLNVSFCNSGKTTLVRAADIVSNKIFYSVYMKSIPWIENDNFIITYLP